jgi:hypothetical protein
MKIDKIIESLSNHEISKSEAIAQLTEITNSLRKNSAIEFTVEEVSFSVEDNHAFLKLKLPYRYDDIQGKVKRGDKLDVVLIP